MNKAKEWKVIVAGTVLGILSIFVGYALLVSGEVSHNFYQTYEEAERAGITKQDGLHLGRLPACIPSSAESIHIYYDIDSNYEWAEFTYSAEDETKVVSSFGQAATNLTPLPRQFMSLVPAAELEGAIKAGTVWQTADGETLIIVRNNNKAFYLKEKRG